MPTACRREFPKAQALLGFTPYVIETSIGLDRMFLSIIAGSYTEEDLTTDGKADSRVVMKIPPALAPVKVAVFPLVKKDGLPEIAQKLMKDLMYRFDCRYEEKDTIGKRYRRQDAIGTPFCVTVDYDTLKDNTVTIRWRDSMKQERVAIDKVADIVSENCDINNILKRLADEDIELPEA